MKTPDDINHWNRNASPGDELVYHTGQHLRRINNSIHDGAGAALKLAETYQCFIAQRRISSDQFEYVLIKLSAESSRCLRRYTGG